MTEHDHDSDPKPLPLEVEQQIDRLSDAFEQAWKSDLTPRIEDYLDRVADAGRKTLLHELLVVEFELLQQKGDTLDVESYRQRFRDHESVVDVALVAHERRRQGRAKSPGGSLEGDVAEELLSPTHIGRFEIRRRLGRGGFGVVYLAHDPGLDRLVALKVPRLELLKTDKARENLLHEARTAAKLKHPGLVTVYEVQQEGDLIYIVQEYIEGPNLAQWAAQRRRTWEEIARRLIEITTAIGYVHQQGFYHRDLKPGNILIDNDDHAHVADFGLAVHEDVLGLLKGIVVGTPQYMSPEQVRGKTHWIDNRADIWALGVILYELISGQQPFIARDRLELLEEIQERDPKAPRTRNPDIPKELERICFKCLAKRRTDRYATASDLREDLEAFLVKCAAPRARDLKTSDSLAPQPDSDAPYAAGSTVPLEADSTPRSSSPNPESGPRTRFRIVPKGLFNRESSGRFLWFLRVRQQIVDALACLTEFAAKFVQRMMRRKPSERFNPMRFIGTRLAALSALILFGLASVLVWQYWPHRQGKTVWAVLPIHTHQQLAGGDDPVNSYPQVLRDILTCDDGDCRNEVLNWSSMGISQVDAVARRISKELTGINLSDKDSLVLYVFGSGLTLDGEARILFGDAAFADVMQGSFAVSDLLRAISNCRAGTKLLILDIDVPSFDPRLGILFNEFASCTSRDMMSAEPDLWVLLSHRDFDAPGDFASQRPTLLSALVASILSDWAACETHEGLELRELYNRVLTHCQTRFAAHTADGQLPVLLRAGEYDPISVSRMEEGFTVAQKPLRSAQGHKNQLLRDPAAITEMENALTEMWIAWDGLHDPERQFWAPIDVCPLAWRRVQWDLLQRAREWRSSSEPTHVAAKARAISKDLRHLLTYIEAANGAPVFDGELATLLDSVAKTYANYNLPTVDVDPDTRQQQWHITQRVYNHTLFFLPDFARWHALISLSPGSGDFPPFAQVADQLRHVIELMSELQATLAQREGDVVEWSTKLRTLRARLQTEGLGTLQEELQRDVELAISWKDLAGEKHTSALLDSPLLSASQRAMLLSHWLELRDASQVSEDDDVGYSEPDSLSRDEGVAGEQWRRLGELADIQRRLIALADTEVAGSILNVASKSGSAESDEAIKSKYRQVGMDLSRFYAELPERLFEKWPGDVMNTSDTTSSVAPLRRQLQSMMRLVDARDISRIRAVQRYVVSQEFNSGLDTQERGLSLLNEQQQVELERDASCQVDIAFRIAAAAGNLTAAIQCDAADSVEILCRVGERMVPCEAGKASKIVFSREVGEVQHLTLFLRAVRDSSETVGPVKIRVTLTTRVGSDMWEAVHDIFCQMPAPDHMELIARKIGLSTAEPAYGSEIVQLRCLPNRPTSFALSLVNSGKRQRALLVQLLQLPAVPNATWASGRARAHDNKLAREILQAVFNDGSPTGGLREEFAQTHLLAQSEVIAPPDNRETPLVFTGLASGCKVAKSNDSGSMPAEREGQKNVSSGLLVWIADKNEPARSWAKWLELAVLHPSEYVSASGPSFHDGEISVELQLNRSAGFSWSTQEPVQVAWTGVGASELCDEAPTCLLRKGDVSPDGQLERMELTIDGYPRAFAWDVMRDAAEKPAESVSREGRSEAIRIGRVTARYPQPNEPGVMRMADDVRTIAGNRETIAFKPCERLLVELAADVPPLSFAAEYDPSQAIRLTVDGQIKAGPYYADRDVKTRLIGVGETIDVCTEVHDYAVTLLPGGQDISMVLEAMLPRDATVTAPATLTVQLDGQAPCLSCDPRSYEIAAEQPFSVLLDLEDNLSGIDRVLFGVIADSKELDEATLETRKWPSHPKQEQVTIELPTSGGKLEAGRLYYVAVVAYDAAGNRVQDVLEVQVRAP